MKKQWQLRGAEDWESLAEFQADQWIDKELREYEFHNVRHGRRLRRLMEQFSAKIGGSTPWACQDWANTKAAYRFFANNRISEANIDYIQLTVLTR